MRKYAAGILILVAFTSISCKNKKYCWECRFNKGSTDVLDTTVCEMTEDASKEFQQKTAERLNYQYGQPTTGPGSMCRKTSR
jgi:hypothetical protein